MMEGLTTQAEQPPGPHEQATERQRHPLVERVMRQVLWPPRKTGST